jgi:putative Holliday junction resolvase
MRAIPSMTFDADEPLADLLPTEGRLAGVDFGTVRIGLATCDPSQTWSTPLETYTRKGTEQDAHFFRSLVRAEDIVGWVLGLPIHCDGAESKKSAEVRQFASWLSEVTGVGVAFFDERFTTAEARNLLRNTGLSSKKKKDRLDGMAAHLILVHYLDSQRKAAAHQNQPLDT